MSVQAETPHLQAVEGNPNLDVYSPAEHVRRAERAVIGSIVGSVEAARIVGGILKPQDFYWPQHEYAFTAVQALIEDGQPVDVITVARQLARDGYNPNGRADIALTEMFGEVVVAAAVATDARIVREDAQRRRLHDACMRGIQGTSAAGCDVAEIAAKVAEQAHSVMEAADTKDELAPLGDDLAALVDAIETGIINVIPTGLSDLDHGMPILPGQLITVGARSGVGKSMFGVTMLRKVALGLGRPVLYSSIEMSRHDLLSRVIAAESKVVMNRLTPNAYGIRPDEQEWQRISDASARIADAPMIVDATKKGVTVSHLRSRLLRAQATGRPAALLIVDHIHIMTSVLYNADQRRHQLDEIGRGLKVLAEEFGIPVVALAQLNRKSDDRVDHKPAVGDLFEASAIEHHSDGIILLHRPDKHASESPRAGEIDLIIAKNRNGPEYTVTCAYQGHYGRIADMAYGTGGQA
jgi:replicative DNA helicase